MSTFVVGDRVSSGTGNAGTVVPHEQLVSWCRPVATSRLDGWVMSLVSRFRPAPAPAPLVADGRVYDDLVPVAWDDGAVSVTRAWLLRPASSVLVSEVRNA